MRRATSRIESRSRCPLRIRPNGSTAIPSSVQRPLGAEARTVEAPSGQVWPSQAS